jgi:hypothetical protein
MLDAQGDPHCLALLLESTRAELLDVANQLRLTTLRAELLTAELAQVHATHSAEVENWNQWQATADGNVRKWKCRFEVLATVAGPCFEIYLDAFGAFEDIALNEVTRKQRRDVVEMIELLRQTAE